VHKDLQVLLVLKVLLEQVLLVLKVLLVHKEHKASLELQDRQVFQLEQ
jgi:hypothetical protein